MEAWARWAKNVLTQLGFPAMSIIARVIKYGVGASASNAGVRLTEVDETCELVDRALLKLTEEQRTVIIRHYTKWEPQRVAAKALRMGTDRYSQLLTIAKRRLANILSEHAIEPDTS